MNMNKKILTGVMAFAVSLPIITSCSSDYLDEAPRTAISAETVKSSEQGAVAAVTGLCRQMQRQFDDLKNGNLNASGESFFANLYGEGLGADANIGEITNYASSGCNIDNMRAPSGWWGAWMYRYCYSIIGSANSILASLPESDLSDTQYWLKGCALTMRAHCYWRLMEVFGPRWVDSQNGEAYVLVLRIHANEPNEHPLNTCNEVYDQMYADLNEAIICFGKTSIDRGDELFYPDISVARGTLARMAMLKNDYATAQKMAHDARSGYKIMTPTEYLEGFSTTNDEWMWAPAMDPLGVYYWGFGAHYACNGHYVKSWGYSDSMDYSLYRHLKETDVRAKLYFGPLTIKFAPEIAEKYGIVEEDFFNNDNMTKTKWGVSLTGTGASPKGKKLAMWNFIKDYGKTFNSLRPEDIKGIYLTNTKGISMGVQYKFQGLADGYTSCWPPYMRAAEMLLTEAEAAYHNGDESTALNCLKELMAQRDETYDFQGTGVDLLDEIRLQRRIELWGEGFCWFDYKRWNIPMERKAWDADNLEECGGWPNTLARKFETDFMYGWRVAVPQREFTYNKLADPKLLGL